MILFGAREEFLVTYPGTAPATNISSRVHVALLLTFRTRVHVVAIYRGRTHNGIPGRCYSWRHRCHVVIVHVVRNHPWAGIVSPASSTLTLSRKQVSNVDVHGVYGVTSIAPVYLSAPDNCYRHRIFVSGYISQRMLLGIEKHV